MVENSQRNDFGSGEDRTCIFLKKKKKSVPWRNIRMIHLYTFIVLEMAFADSICQLPSDLELTPGNADKRLSNG